MFRLKKLMLSTEFDFNQNFVALDYIVVFKVFHKDIIIFKNAKKIASVFHITVRLFK